MRQNGLKILLAAIIAVAVMPAVAGRPTGGPGIQQGPVIGTIDSEKPDLVAGFGDIRGRNGLFLGNVCSSTPTVTIDARNHLFITSKGELVFRFNHPITNRGLRPAKNFMIRLRTTNLWDNNTASVRTVANLNPGQSTTLSFDLPILLQRQDLVTMDRADLEFTIDYNNRVRERTNRNNTCRVTLKFTNNKYDFAIQSLRFNRMAPTCVSGQPVYYFDVTVKNQGSGWLFRNEHSQQISLMPLIVQDLHAPYYSNPRGWGGIVDLLPYTDIKGSFKPGESKRYQVRVWYYQNNPDHMRQGPTHLFQASLRFTKVKSATLSIQPPTACRGGQPARLKGLPARSKSKKRVPRTLKTIPAKPLPRR